MLKKTIAIVSALMIIFCSSCTGSGGEGEENYTESPTQTDAPLIEQMKDYITENDISINSFILIKDGNAIEEAYFNDTDGDTPVPVYSCTKSVISALVGIAIDEGKIKSVDEKLPDLLDLTDIDLGDASKSDITLRHLLTMTSGLDPMPSNEFSYKDDAVRYILERPMESLPGKVFAYTSGGPHIVSAILMQAAGMETSDYAQQKLFDPLGIPRPEWQKDRQGLAMGGFGLELTPMQMAKFGLLYLNGGVYDGKRIISKKWIEESAGFAVNTAMPNEGEQSGYGYYWWMNGFGGYSAHGYAGQYIFVLPKHNAVVVFTSRLGETEFSLPYRLMRKYVIPSIEE